MIESAFKHLCIFEAYPSGNLASFKKLQNSIFFDLDNVYRALGMSYESPLCCNCNSFLIFKSARSSLALTVSFDFPFMSRMVPRRLSHTFFSICMTPRLCLSFRVGQYGKSHKQFLLPQIGTRLPERFLFCPTLTSLTFSNSYSSSSVVKLVGFALLSWRDANSLALRKR